MLTPMRRMCGLRLVVASLAHYGETPQSCRPETGLRSLALACALLFLAAVGCGKGGGLDVPPASPPEPTQPPTGAIQGTVMYSGRIGNGQPILIEVFAEGYSKPIASTQVPSPGGAYAFELAPRSYTLRAWISAHGDPGTRLPADPTAWYDPNSDQTPDAVQVTAKATAAGIDITLSDPPSGGIQGSVRYVGKQKFEVEPPIRILALRSYGDPNFEILGETQIWYPGGEYSLSATGALTCHVVAWMDVNFSGFHDWGDTSYVHCDSMGVPAAVEIRDDAPVTGIDFEIEDPYLANHDLQNWADLRSPTAAGGYVTALAADPGVSGTLYAAVNMAPWNGERDTNYGKVYRSTDGGASWQTLFTTVQDIRALAVHGDTLYAGCTGDEMDAGIIFKSADGGKNWAKVHATVRIPPGYYRAQALAINPAAPSTVYAAGWYLGPPWDARCGLILRSTDDGKTWESVFQSPASGDYTWNLNQICALAVDPVGQVVLAAGEVVVDGFSRGAIYRSADAGAHWTRTFVTDLVMQITSLWIHPVTPTLVYAGSQASAPNDHSRSEPDQAGPVFFSSNGGQSWSRVMGASGRLLTGVHSAVSTPSVEAGVQSAVSTESVETGGPDLLVATHGSGLDVGPAGPPNGGTTNPSSAAGGWARWSELPVTTTGNLCALLADPFVPGRLYAGFERGGVWMSETGVLSAISTSSAESGGAASATWQEHNRGIRSVVYPRAIAIDPHDRNRIAVAAGVEGGFVSGDDGAMWSQVITRECHTFAFDPSQAGVVYAGVSGYDLPSLLRSSDGGLSWSGAYTAPWVGVSVHPGRAAVDALAIAPSGTMMYAAGLEATTDFGWGTLLRSTDRGLHWTLALTTPLWNYGLACVAIDPRHPDVAYAGGPDAVVDVGELPALWRTDDGGAHWSRVHCAACDVGSRDRITSIVIDPLAPNHVLVANSGMDIALSVDGGHTWQKTLSGKDSGYSLAMDPYDPRHVYTVGIARMQESSDGGQTWSGKVKEGMSGAFQSVYGALAIDNRDGEQSLYVGSMGVSVRRRKLE